MTSRQQATRHLPGFELPAPPVASGQWLRSGVVRRYLTWQHRWTGLVMSAFLFVAALTGSLLAFNSELERLISPQLFATPRPGVAPLGLAALIERAAPAVPHGRVTGVSLVETDHAEIRFAPRLNPATGKPFELGFTEFFSDPWTGRELGRRRRGDLSEGLVNLMPFIYDVHWRLALGSTGQWIMGILALVWSIDCFVGFYLTLPRGRGPFWRRWRLAWQVKWNATSFRLNFDLHRAAGLWQWPLLFILAWSSVMMNIRPAYEKVMHFVFDYRSQSETLQTLPRHPASTPRLAWHEAEATGRKLMAEQAALHGFTVREALGMSYSPSTGTYRYEVRGSRDLFERAPKGGSTYIMFDGNNGALVNLYRPTGEHTGSTAESWLYALHMTRIYGLAYQVLVCLVGVFIAMMTITGVYIWWRKRAVRQVAASRRMGGMRGAQA